MEWHFSNILVLTFFSIKNYRRRIYIYRFCTCHTIYYLLFIFGFFFRFFRLFSLMYVNKYRYIRDVTFRSKTWCTDRKNNASYRESGINQRWNAICVGISKICSSNPISHSIGVVGSCSWQTLGNRKYSLRRWRNLWRRAEGDMVLTL